MRRIAMTNLLTDFLVYLGVRSRCHRAPVYRATGWGWRALHLPEVNSTSALFPTPLCRCGDAHPCATYRALDATPETGGES